MNNGMFKLEEGYEAAISCSACDKDWHSGPCKSDGFWYLGSPYSKYPPGRLQAYMDIQRMLALCIANGFVVYCPIVHSHYVSFNELLIDRKEDYDLWLGIDKVFLDASIGLIVTKMEGWDISHGLTWEIEYMKEKGKPIIYTEWMELPIIERG